MLVSIFFPALVHDTVAGIFTVSFSLIHSDLLIKHIQKLLELLKEVACFVTLFSSVHLASATCAHYTRV